MARSNRLLFSIKLYPDVLPVCSNYLTAPPLIFNWGMGLQWHLVLPADAFNIVGIPFGLSHCASFFILASVAA